MFYDLIIYFFIYGFIGWVIEVAFHAAAQHKLVNRGFLNGAICPIYGVGMVILIVLLEPFKDNIPMLFLGSVVVCSVLELITGFILEKIFHHRWWDYSKEKFNIGGYICLKFSLCWGVAGLFAIKIVHGFVEDITGWLPDKALIFIAVILLILLIVDAAATVINVRGLNKEMTHIDEMGDAIRKISDELTKMIYDESLSVQEKYDERKPEIEAKKKELEELRNARKIKRERLASSMSFVQKRLVKAFPNAKPVKPSETMEEIKRKILR